MITIIYTSALPHGLSRAPAQRFFCAGRSCNSIRPTLLIVSMASTSRTLILAPPGGIDSTGPLSGSLSTASITLTPLQVNTMFTTPITLVPAVTGTAYVPISFTVKTVNSATSATAFTGGGILSIGYTGALTAIGTAAAAVVTVAAPTGAYSGGAATAVTSSSFDARSLPIVISNASAVFAGGVNSTVTVTVTYSSIAF